MSTIMDAIQQADVEYNAAGYHRAKKIVRYMAGAISIPTAGFTLRHWSEYGRVIFTSGDVNSRSEFEVCALTDGTVAIYGTPDTTQFLPGPMALIRFDEDGLATVEKADDEDDDGSYSWLVFVETLSTLAAHVALEESNADPRQE